MLSNLLLFHHEVEDVVRHGPDEIRNVRHDEVQFERLESPEALVLWMLCKPSLRFWQGLFLNHGDVAYVPHDYERYGVSDETNEPVELVEDQCVLEGRCRHGEGTTRV